MKKVLLLSALVLSSASAQASLKFPGQFVARECSVDMDEVSTQVIAVSKVCFGTRAAFNDVALAVYLNDGTQTVYTLQTKGDLVRMGANTTKFKGESVRGLNSAIKGEIITVMGIRRSVSIKFVTSENLKFEGNLEPVYTTL